MLTCLRFTGVPVAASSLPHLTHLIRASPELTEGFRAYFNPKLTHKVLPYQIVQLAGSSLDGRRVSGLDGIENKGCCMAQN